MYIEMKKKDLKEIEVKQKFISMHTQNSQSYTSFIGKEKIIFFYQQTNPSRLLGLCTCTKRFVLPFGYLAYSS